MAKEAHPSARERRKLQNRTAQRKFRAKKKAQEREAQKCAPKTPHEVETTSPTLDVGILDRPSARLRIEISYGKLEKALEQYTKLVAENVEDTSVTQFVKERWLSLCTMLDHVRSMDQEYRYLRSPFSSGIQGSHLRQDPAIREMLFGLERKLVEMRTPHFQGLSGLTEYHGTALSLPHLAIST